MSSSDVHDTVLIIDVILGAPELEISEITLKNLMATIDNVQKITEVGEVRRDDTSDKLRESAVKIMGKIAETGEKDTFIPLDSIGLGPFIIFLTVKNRYICQFPFAVSFQRIKTYFFQVLPLPQ